MTMTTEPAPRANSTRSGDPTNRLAFARPAVRPALKARAMLSGPAGAGKTRSALIVATVLAEGGTVLVIDTERESALTYADDFTFDHLPWEPPFDPRALGTTLFEAGSAYDVVVVDSASHFWRGDGGTLDIAGGKFTGWKDARPAQIDLVDAMLGCTAHVIVCSRSKMEHVQEVDKNGKHVVRKLGMAVIQDDDMEYELNVALELDMDHSMTVSKSRTVAVPVGRNFKAGHAEDFATSYRDWLKGGEPPAPQAVVDGLVDRMNALDPERRKAVKQEFVATFGRPNHLRAAQVDDAAALVSGFEADQTRSPAASGAAEGGLGAQTPPEGPAGPPGSAQDGLRAANGWCDGDVGDWVIGWVSGLDRARIFELCDQAGVDRPKGNTQAVRLGFGRWVFERCAAGLMAVCLPWAAVDAF